MSARSDHADGLDWRWVAKLGLVAFGSTFIAGFVLAFVVAMSR